MVWAVYAGPDHRLWVRVLPVSRRFADDRHGLLADLLYRLNLSATAGADRADPESAKGGCQHRAHPGAVSHAEHDPRRQHGLARRRAGGDVRAGVVWV